MHDEREQRIAAWRRQLSEELKCRREVLDELESHLREELDRSLAPSLEQAWQAAVAKLGDVRTLAEEFAKITPPVGWLPARWAAWAALVVLGMLMMLTPAAIFGGGGDPLLVAHVMTVLLGYLITMLVGCLGICFAVTRPFSAWHPGRSRSFRRVALPLAVSAAAATGVAILLGMQWALREWGWAWSWDSKETGALAVVIGNLLLAGLLMLRAAPDRLLMGLTLVNSLVVWLAWFHPLLGVVGDEALHLYGWSAFAPALIAVLVVQAILVVVVAMPARWLGKRAAAQ